MKKKCYITASVHGMCGGVFSALRILDEATAGNQEVYVFRELVHNRAVTAKLTVAGVHFVNDIDHIPAGSAIVIGAHGVSAGIEAVLRAKASSCRDATCPLVKKLHHIAASLSPDEQLVICGKSGHPEVAGIAGNSGTEAVFIVPSVNEVKALPELTAPVFISQTTVDHQEVATVLNALKKRFPHIKECSSVCDASRKRQNAVIQLASKCDVILVIGSPHSSNAQRLREIAGQHGAKAFLIDNADEIPAAAVNTADVIGITSGASTPEYLFDAVVEVLESMGFTCGDDAVSGNLDT